MTRLRRHLLVLCGMTVWSFGAHGYELATHEEVLTREAANRSLLQTDPSILSSLGLTRGITDTAQKFPDSRGDERTIRGLIEIGSRREDDIVPVIAVLRHFYDPISGLGLNIPSLPTQTASPDWALRDKQEFSYLNARQYLFDALTKRTESDRKRTFGLAFQSLGHVVHHLQDMAAPQHVRNDVHCDSQLCRPIGAFAPSLYEKWTDSEAVRRSLPTDPSIAGYNISSPVFTSTFAAPRNFWHTEPAGPGSVTSGKGIAEFTNRNFVSAGTNFDFVKQGLFPSPVRDEGKTVEMDIRQLCANASPPCPNSNLTGTITFYGNEVDDRLTGQKTNNPFASSLSIFDADLRKVTGTPLGQPLLFTLNRFNFALAHAFLTPRAVAFSAGMINYFFRGRLDAEPQGTGTLLVKNLSTEAMQGDFGLYYDDAQSNRHPVIVTACRVGAVDAPVDQGKCKGAALAPVSSDPVGRLTLNFDPPTNPTPKTPGEYMLVFNGKLGEEAPDAGSIGAVVGKLVSNPYKGVLYLAGEDSSGVVRYFKVDRSGVSFVQPGELNPLFGVTGFRERAYHFKQAVVTTTPSGAPVHKTVALAYKSQFGDTSLIPNPAAAGALRTVFGISWSAQSQDAAVGSFEFRLVILDGTSRTARLDYTRRFTNAQGQPAQVEGTLRLPDLPANAAFTYAGFSTGLILVSPDGTEIYPRGPTHSRRHGVRISLSAAPTAALFDLPQQTSSLTSKPGFLTVTEVGQCVVNYMASDFSGSPPFPTTESAPLRREERLVTDSESTSSSTQIEDFMHGSLLSYEIRTQGRFLDRMMKETCIAAAVDWSGPTAQVKVNIRHSEQSEGVNRTSASYILPSGTLQHVTDNSGTLQASAISFGCGLRADIHGPAPSVNGPSIVGSGGFFHDVNYSYEGFGPCPAQPATIRVPAETGTPKHRLYRALTDRSADAVYTEDVNSVAVLKFRTERISSGFFLADASPIGEVFIATPDLSLLVHEPKPGNMPVLTRETIPAGIVRLLAAVWM